MENDPEENLPIDTPKLDKELQEFIATAKKEAENIQKLSTTISTKSEEIELYYSSFSDLRTKLGDSTTGLQALLNESTNTKNQIEKLGASAQAQLDQITTKANDISLKVKEIESYFGTFSDLRIKLGDSATGLQALLDQSTAFKKQIEQLATTAKAQLDQITERIVSTTTKTQEIEDFYTKTFTPLKAQIDDKKTGLQAVLGSATGLKDEIIKTKAATDENFRQIKNLTDESVELKKKSETSFVEIEVLKTRSAEFKSDIEQTFRIATDVSLANSFNERKKDLEKEVAKWLKHVTWSTSILAVSVLMIYFSQYIRGAEHPNDWRFWYRFAFTSPIIFYVFFASHNYNKARDLLEKYAFKFATSLSLQSYTKLLTDTFRGEKYQDELLKFSIRSIDMVYKEPYVEKDKSKKFSIGNRIINIGLEDVETLVKNNVDVAGILDVKKAEPPTATTAKA